MGAAGWFITPKGDKVCRYDVVTGQREATAARLPDDWTQARFEEVVDGHLFLVRGKRGKRDTAALPSALPSARCSVPTLRTAGSG